jgi:hypothetical protein
VGLGGACPGANNPIFDLNGDFIVDVDDLLAVLGAWGHCSIVPGATCGDAIPIDDFCSFSCTETVVGSAVGYVG